MAFLLALGFGLFTAEMAIADVHDGDATDSMIGHVGSRSQAPDAPDNRPEHPLEDFSGHAVHVCHCVHMHGGLPASVDLPGNKPPATPIVLAAVVQAPARVDLEPKLRPPIA